MSKPPFTLKMMKQRADFVAASRSGLSAAQPGLVLQIRYRKDQNGPRIGYTASKKVGGAVQRNRAKRRLRALAGEVIAAQARLNLDYVLIARVKTGRRAFTDLRQDLNRALKKLKLVASAE